jgi:protein SCO1
MRWLSTLVFCLALHFVAGGAQANSWGKEYFPDVEVVDQDGRKLKFYSDVLKGKQVVISFMFTSCVDLCPITTARLAQVKALLGKGASKDLLFVSLSVDPENDTPEKLKAFSEAFGTGDNWILLTGTKSAMRAINFKLGNKSEVRSQHRNEVVLGNEALGEWQRSSAFIEPERLAFDILQLDPEWRDTPRAVSFDTTSADGTVMTSQPGQVLFRKLCSSCHTVGVGKRVGPDLLDVTEHRSEKWLKTFIANPPKMVRGGDEQAVALDRAFPGVSMPAMGLTEADLTDVLSYLKAASEQVKIGRIEEPPHDHSKHKH